MFIFAGANLITSFDMGLIFRKRVKILPGVTVNFGKRGTSVTVGKRGASVNFSNRGVYGNAGIPGTGISYRERLDKPKTSSTPNRNRVTRTNSYSFSSGTASSYNAQNNSNTPSEGTMYLLLAVFGIATIIFFILAFLKESAYPGIRLFLYSIASIGSALCMIFLGFTLNSLKKEESDYPLVLGGISLIATGIIFIIWECFWPSSTTGYRIYYGTRIPETVELGGWKTFGTILSIISIVVGGAIALLMKNNSNKSNT